jgi:hypothetical protein
MISSAEKYYFNGEWVSTTITYSNGTVTSVPNNNENSDHLELLKWVAEGNTIIDNGGA